jgi:hypothetical protein
MKSKLMMVVGFGGGLGDPDSTSDAVRDFELDPAAAAAELRWAGYEVFLLPEKYRHLLTHPLDDFIEAHIEGPDDPKIINAIVSEVEAIVDKYGGVCMEFGPVREDHVPFADFVKDAESH